jgi:hypothetical protein
VKARGPSRARTYDPLTTQRPLSMLAGEPVQSTDYGSPCEQPSLPLASLCHCRKLNGPYSTATWAGVVFGHHTNRRHSVMDEERIHSKKTNPAWSVYPPRPSTVAPVPTLLASTTMETAPESERFNPVQPDQAARRNRGPDPRTPDGPAKSPYIAGEPPVLTAPRAPLRRRLAGDRQGLTTWLETRR